MKILFVSVHGDPLERLGSTQAGGQNNYVKQIASALEIRGHQIDVATHWNNKKVKGDVRFGEHIHVIRIAAGRKEFVRKEHLVDLLPAFFEDLKRRTDLSSYDVIHSNYWLSGLVGLMIKEEFGKPLVHTSHSLGHVKQKATGIANVVRLEAERQILEKADCVIATTLDEKNKIYKHFNNMINVKVVSIGVNQVFFDVESRDIPEQPHFVFVGRLIQAKGIYVLLRAFANFLNQVEPNAILTIAGGGKDDFIDQSNFEPSSAEIREIIDGIESHVQFVGPKSQAELAQLFRTSSAVIIPSFYESFGMVASEAQATGVPVLASRVGGLKNVVCDGETGLLFKNKNISELVACMKRITDNRALNVQFGNQARDFASDTFNWASISKSIEMIYEQLRS